MLKKIFLSMLICPALIFVISCAREDEPKKINLDKREAVTQAPGRLSEKHIKVALGGMITPKEGFVYYRQFLDYLGEKLGMHIDLVDKEDYGEINKLIRNGSVDAAFVCGGPYVSGHKEFGMELLAAPQAYGETVYYSYIIVAKDSPINKFSELRGRTFAFADPLSNSGRLVPEYMLAKMNESPDTFFKRYIFTNAHDRSIKAVAQGIVDGAAVDSLIWEYENRLDPEYTVKTKIINKSSPYGIPPVVVSPGLDRALKERIREAFLNAHKDEKGREILKNMMIDKFVPIDDSAYDSIREIQKWVEIQRAKRKQK